MGIELKKLSRLEILELMLAQSEDMEAMEKQIAAYHKEIEEYQDMVRSLKDTLSSNASLVKRQELEIASLKEELEGRKYGADPEALLEAQHYSETLRKELLETKKAYEQLMTQYSSLKQESVSQSAKVKEYDRMESRYREILEDILELKEELADVRKENRDLRLKMKQFENKEESLDHGQN